MYVGGGTALIFKSFTKYFVQRYFLGESTSLFVWELFFDCFLILFSCGKHHYSPPGTFSFVFPPPATRPAAGRSAGRAAPHSSRRRDTHSVPHPSSPKAQTAVTLSFPRSSVFLLDSQFHALQMHFLPKQKY